MSASALSGIPVGVDDEDVALSCRARPPCRYTRRIPREVVLFNLHQQMWMNDVRSFVTTIPVSRFLCLHRPCGDSCRRRRRGRSSTNVARGRSVDIHDNLHVGDECRRHRLLAGGTLPLLLSIVFSILYKCRCRYHFDII